MLDLMYYLPSYKKVREFNVTKEMVLAQKISLTLLEKAGRGAGLPASQRATLPARTSRRWPGMRAGHARPLRVACGILMLTSKEKPKQNVCR